MKKRILKNVCLIAFTILAFSCKEKDPAKNDAAQNEEKIESAEISENVIAEEKFEPEEIFVTNESLENNYLLIGENKVSVEAVFTTQNGDKIFSLYKSTVPESGVQNPEFYYGTYLYSPARNELQLLSNSTDFLATEFDEEMEIDGDYLIRFYYAHPDYCVDLFNYKNNEYVFYGYDGNLNLENHTIQISLTSALNSEDEEIVKTDFENYGDAPEGYQFIKLYRYEINYFTGENKIIKGQVKIDY